LEVIDRHNERWLTASELAKAIGYANRRAVVRLYNRNKDEFTASMVGVVNLTPPSGGGIQQTTIFSLRGAHLITIFARTDKAKAFRQFILDLLEREAGNRQPQARITSLEIDPVAVAYDLQQQLENLPGGYQERWLIYMNNRGQRKLSPINRDTWLVTWDEVVELIRTNGFLVPDTAIADALHACCEYLDDKNHRKQI
jgi:prophage antirepressor-like protein